MGEGRKLNGEFCCPLQDKQDPEAHQKAHGGLGDNPECEPRVLGHTKMQTEAARCLKMSSKSEDIRKQTGDTMAYLGEKGCFCRASARPWGVWEAKWKTVRHVSLQLYYLLYLGVSHHVRLCVCLSFPSTLFGLLPPLYPHLHY